MASEPTLSSLAALAASSSAVDDEAFSADPSSSTGTTKTKEQLRRHYVQALHKVIDESDIIVLVLDARDPEGCRSRLVEEEVRRRESEGKRLVFVLNKIGAYSCFRLVLGDSSMKICGRPHPSGERTRVVAVPPPQHPYTPVQVRRVAPTIEPFFIYGSRVNALAEGV